MNDKKIVLLGDCVAVVQEEIANHILSNCNRFYKRPHLYVGLIVYQILQQSRFRSLNVYDKPSDVVVDDFMGYDVLIDKSNPTGFYLKEH